MAGPELSTARAAGQRPTPERKGLPVADAPARAGVAEPQRLPQAQPPLSPDTFADAEPSHLTLLGEGVRWALGGLHALADRTESTLVVGVSLNGWVAGKAGGGAELRLRLAPQQPLETLVNVGGGVNLPKLPVNVGGGYSPGHGSGFGASVVSPVAVPIPKAVERVGIPYPKGGSAPIGMMKGRDPLMGRFASLFIAGVATATVYEGGGIGGSLNIVPAWLRPLQGGRFGAGPGIAAVYFGPLARPVTSFLFALPEKRPADAVRAVRAGLSKLGEATGLSEVDRAFDTMLALCAAFLRANDPFFATADDALTALASSRMVVALAAQLDAWKQKGQALSELTLAQMTDAVFQSAKSAWGEAVQWGSESRLGQAAGALAKDLEPMLALAARELQREAGELGDFGLALVDEAGALLNSPTGVRITGTLAAALQATSRALLGDGPLDPVQRPAAQDGHPSRQPGPEGSRE